MNPTLVQRQTMDELIRLRHSVAFPPDLAPRLRGHIEAGLEGIGVTSRLRLSKERLNDLARCEGLFHSRLSGERAPFELTFKPAAGTLLHKAVEVDVGAREEIGAWDLAERAASRLQDDRRFRAYWESVGPAAQDELLMETVRAVEMFRASFPPLRLLRPQLAPVTEMWLEAGFRSGMVIVSGCVDLLLHRHQPPAATRLLLDLKSGRAWPEHPEDMRMYALLYTLRFGIPPVRVATLFLASGQWQAEDVTEEALFHAADRVVAGAGVAARLTGGQGPQLAAGPHCSWCPRQMACPAAKGRVA